VKVSHLNTSISGGAAIAARRIHHSLLDRGLDSKFYHLEGQLSQSSYVNIEAQINVKRNGGNLASKLYTKVKKKLFRDYINFYTISCADGYEQFSPAKLTYKTSTLSLINVYPDIINLHWIYNLIDYPSFFNSIPENLPIVWTLHDMNPLTGGCHYAWECDNYKTHCGNCPQLGKSNPNDLSFQNFGVKKKALSNRNLHIVANSSWIEEQARASPIFKDAKSFQTIHCSLNEDAFYPRDKLLCRQVLQIQAEFFVIAFGADDLANKRKGMPQLMAALNLLNSNQRVLLLTFGMANLSLNIVSENILHKHLGFVSSEEILSIIYSAADLFVIPSLYEAFGQTSLEAMFCGTPVVGFDTGGIPDMVVPHETGLLAQRGSVQDLARKIQWMIDHPDERIRMGKTAIKLGKERFSRTDQSQKYIDLYARTLENV
jgi:glycosyltransferase involved in cell wall biosynthesis